MYTLREVSENQVHNTWLGDCYTAISRFYNKDDFRHYFKSHFEKDHFADLDEESDHNTKNVIAFVISDIIIPIYGDRTYYIMTESGKTFEKINHPTGMPAYLAK